MKAVWTNVRLSVSLVALAGALRLGATEWQIETVDPFGSGQFTSLKIDKDGNAHLAYIPDVEGRPLKYAYWDHKIKKWFTMTVAQAASFCTLILDSKQHPHISFADAGTSLGAQLRHAYWDGARWHVDAITIQPGAVVGYYTSIALDKNDTPVLSYYDYADPGNNFRLRMRSVFWMGNYWQAHTVDAQGGSGKFNSLAMDSEGRPRLAYANVRYESSSLRYAAWNGQAWATEVIEGASGPCPTFSVNMVLGANDAPHIAYSLPEQRQVKYATKVSGAWKTEVVGPIAKVANPDRNGIALDIQGNPYISFYDEATGIFKIAHREGGKWRSEVVDQNYAGFTSSIAVDQGTLWVAYANDFGKSLKLGRRPLDESASAPPPDTVAGRTISQQRPDTASVRQTK